MEKKTSKIGALKYAYTCVNEYSKKYYVAWVLWILSTILAAIPIIFVSAICVKYLQDEQDYSKFVIYLTICLSVYFLLQILSTVFEQKVDWENVFVRIRIMFMKLYKKNMTCDYSYFEDPTLREKKVEAASSLWSNWRGGELILKSFPRLIIYFISLILYVIYTGFISPWLILVILLMAIIHLILGLFANRYYMAHNVDRAKHDDTINYVYKCAKDPIYGKDIRNYKLRKVIYTFLGKEYTLFKKYLKIQRRFMVLPNLSNSIIGFARDIIAYIVLINMVTNGQMTLTEFTVAIGVLNALSTTIDQITGKIIDLDDGCGEFAKFVDFLNIESIYQNGTLTAQDVSKDVSIEFKDVSFKYGDKEILSHLSFKISPKEKIALVGENGAGKTTIIKLLCGFYKPTSGEILIDGKSIADFNMDEYRTLLSVVNQEVGLMGLTVSQVVSCSNNPDKAKLDDALMKAGIKEKIDALPNKENTYVTQNLSNEGVEFSGGESQKLMLARALYKDGSILLLDEPTSALDPIAEGKLYKEYDKLTKDKTSIFISHRLSSTRFCDKILYLKDGKIIESGTHDELMKKNGEYAHIFDIQAHYYKEENE